jgi:hypothetical protein
MGSYRRPKASYCPSMTSASSASQPAQPTPGQRARRLWQLLEPVHAAVYFAPEAKARFEDIGLKGFWMGYFASRAAALGPVGPEVVQALFYVFSPAMVSRALPDAWQLSTPEAVLSARSELAHDSLRAALGDLADGDEVRTAAEIAVPIAQAAPPAGRPLAAAHAALPVPPDDQPLLQLWWAATVLREHRGDGHMATLLLGEIDPCAALVLAAAGGAAGPQGAEVLRNSRRWTEDEWRAATERLVLQGLVDESGGLTDDGRGARVTIEVTTDRAAAVAYTPWDDAELDRLTTALRTLVSRIVTSGAIPFPNPVGLDPSLGLGQSPGGDQPKSNGNGNGAAGGG